MALALEKVAYLDLPYWKKNLGHDWRVLHPFEIPGVRFPTNNTPPNQMRLAENDALVELIQTTEYLEDTSMWEQRDYQF